MKGIFFALLLLAAPSWAQDKPPLSVWTYSAPNDHYCLTDTVSDIVAVPLYVDLEDPNFGLVGIVFTLEYDASYWYPLYPVTHLPIGWFALINLEPNIPTSCGGNVNKVMSFSIFAGNGCNPKLPNGAYIPIVMAMQRTGKAGHTPIKLGCSFRRCDFTGYPQGEICQGEPYVWGYGIENTFIGNSCWDLRDGNCQEGEVQRCPDNGPTRRDCGHCPPVVSDGP